MEHNRPESYEHYRLVRTNPEYALEGRLEVLREEIMMAMPIMPEPQVEVIPEIHYIPVEPKAHMTRVRKLEEQQQNFENYTIRKLNELSQRKREYKQYD